MGFVKEEDNLLFLFFPSMFLLLLIYQRKLNTDLAPVDGAALSVGKVLPTALP